MNGMIIFSLQKGWFWWKSPYKMGTTVYGIIKDQLTNFIIQCSIKLFIIIIIINGNRGRGNTHVYVNHVTIQCDCEHSYSLENN